MTKRTMRISLVGAVGIFVAGVFLALQPAEFEGEHCEIPAPYPREPGWSSADVNAQSLGMALADINGDGFKDLIVANGNDLARNPVTVYYNDKHGGFPKTPNFSSSDVDYHAGIAVGDINHRNGRRRIKYMALRPNLRISMKTAYWTFSSLHGGCRFITATSRRAS